ncbi:hypothetical protein MF628_000935 [Paenibacillus polymyxa]|uniref:hypothetical protein n=1 Tax=Paenibacillus polymyxa TaxID=1406 RepID=UPI0020255A41|nr:hypothetical protein [Paenibacillus polymyxa]URJ46405.1 hypothetical protein MF628_000935 [Paenibacillus polymyxa]
MATGQVNPNLYDLLKERETGLYIQNFEKNRTVFAYVHLDFGDISDFVKLVGDDYLCEGGYDAKICPMSVVVEINDVIERFDNELSDYKNCFDEDDWKRHEKEIAIMEA